MSKTEVMGVRVERAEWDAFGAKCLKAGTTRNAMLVAFIKSELGEAEKFTGLTAKPQPDATVVVHKDYGAAQVDNIYADKPIGFDAATGEPIFKRGVGPQKGKK